MEEPLVSVVAKKQTNWNKVLLKVFLKSLFSCILKIVVMKILVDAVCRKP